MLCLLLALVPPFIQAVHFHITSQAEANDCPICHALATSGSVPATVVPFFNTAPTAWLDAGPEPVLAPLLDVLSHFSRPPPSS
jgi:hypothetical protein